jgi:hypothetical protein
MRFNSTASKPAIRYLSDELAGKKRYTFEHSPVQRSGGILSLLPGQNQMGYGDKISTDWVCKIEGCKPLRVYAVCWSNAASHYVVYGKVKCYLHSTELSGR